MLELLPAVADCLWSVVVCGEKLIQLWCFSAECPLGKGYIDDLGDNSMLMEGFSREGKKMNFLESIFEMCFWSNYSNIFRPHFLSHARLPIYHVLLDIPLHVCDNGIHSSCWDLALRISVVLYRKQHICARKKTRKGRSH